MSKHYMEWKFANLMMVYAYVYATFCAIWCHLYNLKNLKNTHGGVFSLQLY